MTQQELPWVNYDEAMARVRGLGDASLEQFVMRAVTLIVQRFAAGRMPQGRLDMLYVVEVLIDLYGQRADLARIFNGEDLRWFAGD